MSVEQLRVLLVPTSGPARVVEVADDVQGLQQLVGGFFECFKQVGVDDERALLLWCNDTGKLDELPVNHSPIVLGWYAEEVRGPVVVTAGDLASGETYSLSAFEVELLAAIEAGRPLPSRA